MHQRITDRTMTSWPGACMLDIKGAIYATPDELD